MLLKCKFLSTLHKTVGWIFWYLKAFWHFIIGFRKSLRIPEVCQKSRFGWKGICGASDRIREFTPGDLHYIPGWSAAFSKVSLPDCGALRCFSSSLYLLLLEFKYSAVQKPVFTHVAGYEGKTSKGFSLPKLLGRKKSQQNTQYFLDCCGQIT